MMSLIQSALQHVPMFAIRVKCETGAFSQRGKIVEQQYFGSWCQEGGGSRSRTDHLTNTFQKSRKLEMQEGMMKSSYE